MKKNYHTHTWRCGHAAGTERDYIEEAIRQGLTTLGFSDHSPQPAGWMVDDGIRMTPAQTEGYFAVLSALKEEYADRIKILIGVEAEYSQESFPGLLEHLKSFPCDYLIMGQHYMDQTYVRTWKQLPQELERHVSIMLEGMATGKFLYLAHPDLMSWDRDDIVYAEQAQRLCEGMKKLDIPIEFNLLGFRNKRSYPDPKFWRIAGRVGNRVIFGMDAHKPGDLDVEILPQARKLLAELGIEKVENDE